MRKTKRSHLIAAEEGLNALMNDSQHMTESSSSNSLPGVVPISISSHGVIHVIPKAGIPSGRPLKPLKFEGRLGWKGAAETSAFRPAAASENVDGKICSADHKAKGPEHFTVIDLNVDGVEDTATGNGISLEHEGVSSPSALQRSDSGVDRKQGKSPWIDLNCVYDAGDEATHPFIPPKSESSPLEDLSLDTSVALRSSSSHWLGQGCQLLGARRSEMSNSGTKDFSLARNGHALVAWPTILQSMEAMQRVASHTAPPRSYSAKGPFHFGSGDPLPSSVNLPGTFAYTRNYQEQVIFSEPLNPGAVRNS